MLSMQSESTISAEPNFSGEVSEVAELLTHPDRTDPGVKGSIRRIWAWMSPMRIWREIHLAEAARRDFAVGLAIGVFIACVPLYGLQTILSLFTARRLSLHPLPILAGSQLSSPPFAPALGIASIVLGHLIIFGKMLHLTDWHGIHWPELSRTTINSFAGFAASWLLGGAILGAVLAGITYLATCAIMRLFFPRPQSAA
jgi:uncharacterized protein (DUF2062 family)